MKHCAIAFVFITFFTAKTISQKIDSIYFHLYTDSLKKGVYNYINVDGLLSNGHFVPLDTTQVIFTSSDGKWIGNNLILEPSFSKEFVTVTAQLKSNRSLQKTVVIYMKKRPDDEKLKTEAEIMNEIKSGKNEEAIKQKQISSLRKCRRLVLPIFVNARRLYAESALMKLNKLLCCKHLYFTQSSS